MQTLEGLRKQRDGVLELQSVVMTMKTLAAVNIQQFQGTARALDDYERAIKRGLQIVVQGSTRRATRRRLRPDAGPVGLIVIGSDQGMCGQFNQQIAEFTSEAVTTGPLQDRERVVIAIGLRVTGPLLDLGLPTDQQFSISSSLRGIAPLVQELLVTVDDYQVKEGVEQFVMFHQRPLSQSTYRPERRQVLPVDPEWINSLAREPWPGPTLPTYRMEWSTLFRALIRQYLLLAFYRGTMHSLASENAARLAAMQAAESNIEDLLEDLQGRYQHRRQAEITDELMDVIAGYEAMGGEEGED